MNPPHHTEPVGELLVPDEIAYDLGIEGFVTADGITEERALEIAARDLGVEAKTLRATAVLMREESEVEAKINGNEVPLIVECTSRARHPVPYWRIEAAS